MKNYKTRGIIIKRTNFGEADRIITIFSEKFGKLKVIARGIRKIKSKLSGNLELFCLSELNIAEGRNLDIITAAEIFKCYFNIRNNLKATRQAFYFSELIEKLTEENEPHREIYRLLDDILENLNTIQNDLLIPYFEWNLLAELGYYPEIYRCVKCKKKLVSKEKIYFNFIAGGTVCENCQKGDSSVAVTTLKLLRLFLTHEIIALNKIQLDTATLQETKKIIRLYLGSISDKEFRSQRFLK